jgi:hypothetical protein
MAGDRDSREESGVGPSVEPRGPSLVGDSPSIMVDERARARERRAGAGLASRFGDGGGQQRAGARERRVGARRWRRESVKIAGAGGSGGEIWRWRRTAESGGAIEESGGRGDDRRQNRAPKIVDAYTNVLSGSRD